MSYPRIFSISTVGVRRHNNQDYLLHSERTDFTGSNGVGKSIIADLLQLIFITDRELIVFGTEGVKSKSRQPHTLPYQSNECYVFLNIEVSKGNFICIGVCIPNQASRKIIPFVIARTTELDGDLSSNTYDSESLLTNKSFLINGNVIPNLADLSKHLRSTYGLYLTHFTFKEDKQDYYRFLYSKQILPINLGIEENLKAFAKTIQSFSKAKTLDLDDSDSLKKFLFDDSEKEYEDAFQKHQTDLNRVLSEYKELEAQIADIEDKQKRLTHLKGLEKDRDQKKKDFSKAELGWLSKELSAVEHTHQTLKDKFNLDTKRNDALLTKQPKFKSVLSRVTSSYETVQKDILALKEYKQALTDLKDIEEKMKLLSGVNTLDISDSLPEIDITQYDVPDIIRRADEIRPLFDQYGSIAAMESKVKEQLGFIDAYKRNIDEEVADLRSLDLLLDHNKKDTLFAQVLSQGKVLTEVQETILFHFLDVNWLKPANVKTGIRYVTSLDVLNEQCIEEDKRNNGYWLKQGEIHYFIRKKEGNMLFSQAERLKTAVKEKTDEVKQSLHKKELVLKEIEKFRLKGSWDQSILQFDSIDLRLIDGTALENIKVSASILMQIKLKIAGLEEQKAEKEAQLSTIQRKVSVPVQRAHIDKQIADLAKREALTKERKERLNISFQNETVELRTFENTLSQSEVTVKEKYDVYKSILDVYRSREDAFQQSYGHLPKFNDEADYTKEYQEELEGVFEKSELAYASEYKAIISSFVETRDNADLLVSAEETSGTYNFSVLETALLGTKIGHLDKITPHLETANLERVKMMDTLYETMMKVFSSTASKYSQYENVIKHLNTFFKGKKISEHYYFKVNFEEETLFNIEWLEKLKSGARKVFKTGELPLGNSLESFVEDFFKQVTGNTKTIHLADLLNPKTYFRLSVSLTDENNVEIPGSTGETYASIILLGIGRLSKVQDEERPGIRFVILEETANLDNANFNMFPKIAKEFGYQLLTMTPRPYGSETGKSWYLHHLIKGKDNKDINYPVPKSYYKTSEGKDDLHVYLTAQKNR